MVRCCGGGRGLRRGAFRFPGRHGHGEGGRATWGARGLHVATRRRWRCAWGRAQGAECRAQGAERRVQGAWCGAHGAGRGDGPAHVCCQKGCRARSTQKNVSGRALQVSDSQIVNSSQTFWWVGTIRFGGELTCLHSRGEFGITSCVRVRPTWGDGRGERGDSAAVGDLGRRVPFADLPPGAQRTRQLPRSAKGPTHPA